MEYLFQSLPFISVDLRPFFYAVAGLCIALFLVRTWDRMSIWQLGVDRTGSLVSGLGILGLLFLGLLKLFSPDCLFAKRVFARSRWRGIMLMLIIWGTLALIAGVVVSAVGYLSPIPFLGGRERFILSFSLNIAGGLLLLGLFIALGRRYVFRPERWVSVMADGILLTMLTVVILLGFVMEGLRLAGTERGLEWPVGTLIGWILTLIIGRNAVDVSGFYMAVYMVHTIMAFALLAYLPFSKLFHVFAAQITTYATSEEKKKFKTRARGYNVKGQRKDLPN